MTVFTVDPRALDEMATAVRAVAVRLESVPAEVAGVGGVLGGPVGLELGALAGRIDQLTARVAAFAQLIAMAAGSFVDTEGRVGASFAAVVGWAGASGRAGAGALAALDPLLAALDPSALAALLDGCPALARLVADDRRPDAPGSTAALLRGVLTSGEPLTVVLLRAHELLAGLPLAALLRLGLLHPALLSGLASAPVVARMAATRVLVSAEIDRLRQRLPSMAGPQRAAVELRNRWYAELLTGSVLLIRPDGSRLVRPHQLLSFDARGDGRIVEVFGDLRVAKHLAVYVPGTGTSLDRYAGNAERASAFAAAEPDLAVVLWQDADFPDMPLDHVVPPPLLWGHPLAATEFQLRTHVLAAAYRDAADQAGPLLARDVQGLQMALPGPGADLTVLGHSYGGSIVGSAEAHGMVVDRVVHIASAGGYVSDVSQYAAGECGTRRFSLTDPDDPIQLAQGAGFGSLGEVRHAIGTAAGILPAPLEPLAVPVAGGLAVVSGGPSHVGHGLDPDQIPSVTRLDSGVMPDGHTLVSGHGGMFTVGSGAWRNLLAVMHGDPVAVLEPTRWHASLVPGDVRVSVDTAGPHAVFIAPHYVVTRSPYDAPGYRPPVQPSTGRVCVDPPSW